MCSERTRRKARRYCRSVSRWPVQPIVTLLFFDLSQRFAKAETFYSPDHFYETFAAPYQSEYGSYAPTTWNRQPLFSSYSDNSLRRPVRSIDALRFVGSSLNNRSRLETIGAEETPVAPLKAPSPAASSPFLPLSPPFTVSASEVATPAKKEIRDFPAPVERVTTSSQPPVAPAVDQPFFEFIAEWEGKPKPAELPSTHFNGDETSQIFDHATGTKIDVLREEQAPTEIVTMLIRVDHADPSTIIPPVDPSPDDPSEQPFNSAAEQSVASSALAEEENIANSETASKLEEQRNNPIEKFEPRGSSYVPPEVKDASALGGSPLREDVRSRPPSVVRAVPVTPLDLSQVVVDSSLLSKLDSIPSILGDLLAAAETDLNNAPSTPTQIPSIPDSLTEKVFATPAQVQLSSSAAEESSFPTPRKFALPCCHHVRSETQQESSYFAQLTSVAASGSRWCDQFLSRNSLRPNIWLRHLVAFNGLLIILSCW